ncbi:metallophosphoesterase family protein [Xinfangfangia sp. CPCC 101601]|uniref:Metallophosphoesterase family protein n=1 Tax=Pseudogemmobacter lacusdianii TaxID=3069608 RepID=A0ABU0VUL4_9RHOB|nr:metallophosphoesterase family protein [Xinfangfangia sp. CPCC 101601]MDQ2065424.1 metallophosphoesterase family protein [Xinfangfangia sp. CPCC 101601]
MRLAILSDIHGNREGFEAVLRDAAAHGAERLVLLGDIVGYGPDPEWCVERAMDLHASGALVLRGNHDNAASGAAEEMSSTARKAMDWTETRLNGAQKAYLGGLPYTERLGALLFSHASADAPEEWRYVSSDTKAIGSFRSSDAKVIFCGHVHVPLLVHCDRQGVARAQSFRTGFAIPLLRSRRWLAVVGSVGQPRDGVAQAGWALFDSESHELTFRRSPADFAKTAEKIRAAGLPESLAQRLSEGR